MNKQKIIVTLLGLFIGIVILIVYLSTDNLLNENNQNTLPNGNSSESQENNNEKNIEVGDPPEENPWAYEESVLAQSDEEKMLEQITDTYSYFLMKQCLSNYYNVETVENALNIIDTEAKETLNINENNVASLYNNFNRPKFCIDKIYKQIVDASKDIYVVYHRLQKNAESNSSAIDMVVFIKIDKKNVDFSVYPYEYLREANYLELEQGDTIEVDDENEIPENDDNGYRTSLISKDDQTCIAEYFDRYQFDIQFDQEGLYSKLNEEYKSLRYPDFNSFKQYIDENIEKIINNSISKYEVNKYDDYSDYVVIDSEENIYIFSAESLMDYTISLDKYTVLTKKYADMFDKTFTSIQTKYCINRVIQAINDKNYEFVYQKLSTIQKNNYYKDIEDFKDFIENNFYEKNNVEIDENYLILSSNCYQYDVKITDATESEFTYRKFKMAVTVKQNADFEISITN